MWGCVSIPPWYPMWVPKPLVSKGLKRSGDLKGKSKHPTKFEILSAKVHELVGGL